MLFCLLLSLFKLSNHTILHPSLHTLKAKAILRHCASDHIFLSLFLKNILKFNLWLCWVWTFPSCGEPWLLLFGPWALQRGFSSGEPAARGIFPDQGWDPLARGFLSTVPPGKSPPFISNSTVPWRKGGAGWGRLRKK